MVNAIRSSSASKERRRIWMTLVSPSRHLSQPNPNRQPPTTNRDFSQLKSHCAHSIQSLDFLHGSVLVFFVIKMEKIRTHRKVLSDSRPASHVAGFPPETLTSKMGRYAWQRSLRTASLFVEVRAFLTGSGSYSEISVTYRKHRTAYHSNRG